MGNKRLLITSADGEVHGLDLQTGKLIRVGYVYNPVNWLMGITRCDDKFYIGSENSIFIGRYVKEFGLMIFEYCCEDSSQPSPQYHHLKAVNDLVFAPATSHNRIAVFDNKLQFVKNIRLNGPDVSQPAAFKLNYNHLNGITYHDNAYYVTLNWYTNRQFDVSGVAVLDDEFNEVNRFEYGWQTHNFCFIDNVPYVLCGYSPLHKQVYHPKICGLMVEGEIVYDIGTQWFCKNFSVDDDYIYIVGGGSVERGNRDQTDGIIIVLDRTFNEVDRYIGKGCGEFRGCLLDDYDLTDV